jgi:hypothetical protein
MGNGLFAQWRRRIGARGLGAAALLAIPVAVAAAIGFQGSLDGLGHALSGPKGAQPGSEQAAADSTPAAVATLAPAAGSGGGAAAGNGEANGNGATQPDTSGTATQQAPSATGTDTSNTALPVGGGAAGDLTGGGGTGSATSGVGGTVDEVVSEVNDTLHGLVNRG